MAAYFRMIPRNALQMGIFIASLVSAQVCLAAAGKVDFAIGNVTAKAADGKERRLAKGGDINPGDTILTGPDGRAQVRMADDSYLSFTPNTEMVVRQFTYDGKTDGQEKAVYNLLKGALRTVSGLVGRVNKQNFSIVTPTATVGIRGTGGEIQVTDDSTIVRGSSGVWILTNQFGTLEVGAGQAGIASGSGAPRITRQGPNVQARQPGGQPRVRTAGEQFSNADQVDRQGKKINIPASVQAEINAGPYAISFEGLSLDGGYGQQNAPGGQYGDNVAINNPNAPTRFATTFTDGGVPVVLVFSSGTATAVNRGIYPTNGTPEVYWGRFTNGTVTLARIENGVLAGTVTRTLSANQGVHTVYGIPTPDAGLPTTGTFTFNNLGGTAPTAFNGAVAPGTASISPLNVNFATRQLSVTITANMGPIGGTYQSSGTISMQQGALFGGSIPVVGSGSVLGTCSANCNNFVVGSFFGANATSAGATYTIRGNGNSIDGATAWSR
jgi:FecR protein